MPVYRSQNQVSRYEPTTSYGWMSKAKAAWQLGVKAKKLYNKSTRKPIRLNQIRKSISFAGNSYMRGPFKKPKKVKPSKEDKALTYGAGNVYETYGQVAGTDCVWVGASTMEITELAKVIAQSIVRKLFRKGGITISDGDVDLHTNTGSPGGVGFQIRKTMSYPQGNFSTFIYNSAASDTFYGYVTSLLIHDDIVSYASGSSGQQGIMTMLELYIIADGSTREVANLNLRNEYVNIKMSAKLTLNNRTKSAIGEGSTDINQIDAQPLKGKIYKFHRSHPEVRVEVGGSNIPNNDSILGRWSNSSIKLACNDMPGYPTAIKEPPSPYYFSNTKSTSNIGLEPGAIRTFYMKNEARKYYSEFIRSLAWFNGAGIRRQNAADCVFVCFEEVLNSGSNNKIAVQYELENRTTCYLTTGKIAPMSASHGNKVENLVL